MKQLKTPFKLGMHYENWEFDLEVAQDRIWGCDSYIYTGKKLNKFLNYNTDKTELIFSLDVLEAVIVEFNNKDFTFFETLNNLIKSNNYKLVSKDLITVKNHSFIITYFYSEKKINLLYFNTKNKVDWRNIRI